jgi:dimeric dUTPase (all-alpha-NTP-PPase superfamily)|tara:strand:+ start:89 stop:451 length:363 start_codon:yes stop_codon:yes gene_type:complete
MSSINVSFNSEDNTVKIFDEFYGTEAVISAEQFDIARAYFRSVFNDNLIAEQFTTTFFAIKETYNKDFDELLKEFKASGNTLNLNEITAYYLNGLRSKSTLLGVTNLRVPNQYVSRNILP